MNESPNQILIVEDDAGHVALLKRRLDERTNKYELIIASSLAQARAYLDEWSPDLVMADLVLPDGSGIELLDDDLVCAQVPLVIMTSQGDEQTAVDALKRGALDYVVKSDEMFEDIERVISRVLREWRHIRELNQAEQQLRQRDAELAHMSRVCSMGEMAAALAHELNQPLAAIANFAATGAHLLRSNDWREEDLLHSIDRINEQALNAGEIIRRLKRFVSRTVANCVALDVNSLVMEVVRLMSSAARQRRIKLTTQLDPGVPDVLGDRIQIQQVLVNLMSNAFEAMDHIDPAARRAVIRSGTEGDFVRISVSDCGIGVPNKVASDLFEPYVTTKQDGMGMGLAIIRRIVKAHRGEISSMQNPTGGATFSFTLPRVGWEGMESEYCEPPFNEP